MMIFGAWKVFYGVLAVQITLTHCMKASSKGVTPGEKVMSDACRIFCRGKLLQYVQMSRIINESMNFVHMKLRNSPDVTEKSFSDLLSRTQDSPSKSQLEKFVHDNFEEPGTEFEQWIPDDWIPVPRFTFEVYDYHLRTWIRDVNKIWKLLGRKLSKEVEEHADLFTQIYLPKPFIVPGGRFSELYYWDSYWIIEGLLLSEMQTTAKGMIENFLYLVSKYGYVPNGNRVYYLGRSQPPFLIPMAELYWKYTKDIDFLRESIGTLEKEFRFWYDNRSVEIDVDHMTHRLYQYKVLTEDPRPESYYQDMNLYNSMANKQMKAKIFSELKSAAESGWDFSSRWFLSDSEHTALLSDINILSIAPVCLNSIMGLNAKTLSKLFTILGNSSKQKEYKTIADAANITMSRIFWSDRDGIWLDYNIKTKKLIPGFYPSNLIPLWTESYGEEREPEFVIEQAIAYMDRNKIFDYPGGIPSSTLESGQQWDMPNGWAPLQYFVVLGLHKAGRYNARAEDLAFTMAKDWVLNVYQTYMNSNPHAIFEKYNVTHRGDSGGGGEYKVQKGFGWTNAVVMKFLSMYGHKIKTEDIFDPAPIVVGLMLMLVTLISISSYMHRSRACRRHLYNI